MKGIYNTTVNPIVSIIKQEEDDNENNRHKHHNHHKEKENIIYQIKDEAGNTTKLYFDKIKQEGKQIKAELKAIQYNNDEIIELEAEIKYEWLLGKDGTIKELEQKIEARASLDRRLSINSRIKRTIQKRRQKIKTLSL